MRLTLARLSKKSAWLTTALTMSGSKGFVIRNVGSGRSPVSSRSGKRRDEDDRHVETGKDFVDRIEPGAAVRELNVGENEAGPIGVKSDEGFAVRAGHSGDAVAQSLDQLSEVQCDQGARPR